MKKTVALLLVLTLGLWMTACGTPKDQAGDSDLDAVRQKGVLVVGITDFKPMDYQDAEGRWIGFDADMASAFARHLGVEAVFRLIEWDSKVAELNDGTIDVVWNGMTLNDDVRAAMETSRPYFNNAQVVIVREADAARYQTAESLSGAAFAVESGSAGLEQARARGLRLTETPDQASALAQVSSGAADGAIVDFLMAQAMIGEGADYPDLTYTVSLSSEEYGVGFRKGSDLAAALNDFFAASYADGTMQSVAKAYGIAAFLLAQ